MSKLADLEPREREEVKDTQHNLKGSLYAVLKQLTDSREELKFPAPVQFGKVAIDSVYANAAANTVFELGAKKQLLLAVIPAFYRIPLVEVGRFSMGSPTGKIAGASFIAAIFAGNFFARCRFQDFKPDEIIKKVITQISYHDAF